MVFSKKVLTTTLAATLIGTQLFVTPINYTFAATTTTSNYTVPTRAIYLTSPTMKGNDVKYIQEGLKKLGYYTGSIDGSFGPACKDATIKFQKANGLTADGSFGPATLKKFQTVLNNTPSYPAPTRAVYLTSPTMKGDDVKYIQEGLKKLGYYTGSIDGSFGPACETATTKFQKANGLSVDGSFGPATLKKFQSVLGYNVTGISTSNFAWPSPGQTRITSYFGPRKPPTSGATSDHKGIDIAAPIGSNIVAVESGTVITSSYHDLRGYYLKIDHGNGKVSLYQHIKKGSIKVKVGDKVSKKQVIALTGDSGIGSGPHLHFEMQINGVPKNPLNYISK